MFRRAPALALLLIFGACSDGPAVTANSAPSATDNAAAAGSTAQVAILAKGTALPAGYKVDPARTMIFGTDDRWLGRLTFTSESTGRMATINIRRGSVIGSTQVDMVVAPKSAQ